MGVRKNVVYLGVQNNFWEHLYLLKLRFKHVEVEWE